MNSHAAVFYPPVSCELHAHALDESAAWPRCGINPVEDKRWRSVQLIICEPLRMLDNAQDKPSRDLR
jgi:hypothetical protein